MRGLIPISALNIQANATGLALSTTEAQIPLSAAVVMIDTGVSDGDISVRNDKANNRFLCAPGKYEVSVHLSGTISATADVVLRARKNAVDDAGNYSARSWTITVQNEHTMYAILIVNQSDVPGTIPNFPNPATPTAPAVSFTGNAGAPLNEVPVDFSLAVLSGSPTITVANATFSIKKIG